MGDDEVVALRARIAVLESERDALLHENLSLQARAGDDGLDLEAIEAILRPILGSAKEMREGLICLVGPDGKGITAVEPKIVGLRKLVVGEPQRVVDALEAVMDAAEWAQPLIKAVRANRIKAAHYAAGMHMMSDAAEHAQRQLNEALAEIERLRNCPPTTIAPTGNVDGEP